MSQSRQSRLSRQSRPASPASPASQSGAERSTQDRLEGLEHALGADFGDRVRRRSPLGIRTTYRVGGPAALLVDVESEFELARVAEARQEVGPVPILVLGKGSNLLVADAGFPGLVVVPGGDLASVEVAGTTVRAGAGAGLPVVARRSAAAGLRGLEWAVGVPGSVGGGVRMNAGGHGSDVAAVLGRARVLDLETGSAWEGGPDRLDLAYRHSCLAPTDVVLWAEFELERGERADAEALISEIVRWRREHQPGGSNAGSVFTNPPGDWAGRLIEAAGLKGHRLGSAQVSEKHANFIQADEGGSADDVWRLIRHVRSVVAERLGVTLVPELRLVGFEADAGAGAEAGGDDGAAREGGVDG